MADNKKRWQQEASFRGAAFFVRGDASDFGRRGVLHEFPGRDVGYYEDLGKLDPVFTLDCYVTELSPGGYAAARDALVKAAETKGEAELCHPYFGKKNVVCTGITPTHDNKENGVCRFTLKFIEIDKAKSPAESADIKSEAQEAASGGVRESIATFVLKVQGVPGFVRDYAAEAITDLAGTLKESFPFVGTVAELATSTTAPLLAGALDLMGEGERVYQPGFNPSLLMGRLTNSLPAHLTAPGRLAAEVAGLVRMVSVGSLNHNTAYTAQKELWNYGDHLPAVPLVTANRRTQADNQAAIINLVRELATYEAARCVPYMQLGNRQEAIGIMEETGEALDAAAERTRSDNVYRRLETMRRVVVADITARAPNLHNFAFVNVATTRPAVVLAYEIYNDSARAAEIVQRNHVRHPGKVPGGSRLEVLTHE